MAIRLRDIPPHLRVGLSDYFEYASPFVLRTEAGAPITAEAGAYLVFARKDVLVEHRKTDRSLLEELTLTAGAVPIDGSTRQAIASVVLAAAALDDLARELGIFTGNVYLASERAVLALLTRSGLPVAEDRMFDVLDLLQNAELLYRFPVAYKFRGTHEVDRQCRVNGWGRILARTMIRSSWAAELDASIRTCLRAHLAENAVIYSEHLQSCLYATDDGSSDLWDSASRLPIPVLT